LASKRGEFRNYIYILSLKSICRVLITKDGSIFQICNNLQFFNIPKIMKKYQIYEEELRVLFEENICANTSS
jgi:hypothetical protein